MDTRARGAAGTSVPGGPSDTRGLGLQSAVSDVAGQDAGASAAAATANMQGLPLARLIGTRTEADQISKLAKASGGQADVWLDLNASEENIETRDVNKYRVIHIATHGLLDADRPQFTGVVLSLIGNKNADGFLRTDEVFNLRLGAPLVMLSACETGLGKEKRGEGVMGFDARFPVCGRAHRRRQPLVRRRQINRRPDDGILQTAARVRWRFLFRGHARSATLNDHRQEIQRAILLGAVRAGRRLAVTWLRASRLRRRPKPKVLPPRSRFFTSGGEAVATTP